MGGNPYIRQNEKESVGLIKAGYRCLKKERSIKYIIICASFLICILGIFNKYLPIVFSFVADIESIQSRISTYINLSSGILIIASLLTSFYTNRMHIEGVVLQERLDCRVFSCPVHHSITRPISQTVIDVYAAKVKMKSEKFKYYYYDSDDDYDPETAHFDYINRQLKNDYRLYLSVQPFFLTVWIGFCIVVLLLAVSFDDKFVNTLINILFPSMSAITIIGNSWYAFRMQIRQLTNALNAVDNILRLPDEQRKAAMTDKMTLRMLQDSLFNFRLSPFVIPDFLIKRHKKQLEKENWFEKLSSSDLIITLSENRIHDKTPKNKRIAKTATVVCEDDIVSAAMQTLYLSDENVSLMPEETTRDAQKPAKTTAQSRTRPKTVQSQSKKINRD